MTLEELELSFQNACTDERVGDATRFSRTLMDEYASIGLSVPEIHARLDSLAEIAWINADNAYYASHGEL